MIYPKDLTLTQWQFIKKTLDFDDRKRKYDLCIIWNAIYYIVKTGCQLRILPSNYPKWQLVYYYYSKWSNLELFVLLLTNLRETVRVKIGQNAEASLGIIDSQSGCYGNNRSLSGFDGNKKIKGITRHVIVDKNGFLLAVMVSVASFHDSKAALLLMRTLHYLLVSVKVILADRAIEEILLKKQKINLVTSFRSFYGPIIKKNFQTCTQKMDR
ncbi:transposase [Chryseobacterium polytrichastri]|uniref:Transposase n=1 Tax=Chryseobacterium polytrichastri TaxID=1302687 RepID=A0A1M7KIZ2_9FLAO|nr:transposase [Chryseobacterium polytrichastri]SHM65223.1 Transposase [Chryseobacterium polytrichastri]